MAFSEQRHRTHSLESCRQFVASFAQSQNLLWAIELSATDEHIGNITVSIDTNNRIADVGILIGAQDGQGKGLGQLAWSTVLQHLSTRPDIYKITGGCIRSNFAMVRIMESCGMTLDCVRKNHYLIDNVPQDLVYYSIPGGWKSEQQHLFPPLIQQATASR